MLKGDLSRVVVIIIADDVALPFSLFSLIAVFIKVRRQHKRNMTPDIDETC